MPGHCDPPARPSDDGDPNRDALNAALAKIYDELRALAASFLAREQNAKSLQPTALVHEVYERLLGQRNLNPEDRSRFFAAAAAVMRRVLIDHARARNADKRGGDARRVPLDSGIVGTSPTESHSVDVLALDAALERLAKVHERAAKVVELRFFGGLSAPETARSLGVSERLVFDDWAFARAYLHRELEGHAKA